MPSHQYEQLNDESFQQLSQSLIVKEFPGLQCFPVGQPDGGRDATSRIFQAATETNEFNLFQVKFARRELSPSEARKWLLRTLRKELPNIRKQIGNGAKRFVLVTNVQGTSHPETGSIDKLQALLNEYIPIHAQAWWRDDLDRRLDDSWDLMFKYPALLTGTDFLRLLIEKSPSEGRQRRELAITTFLSAQYEMDREVKFKQVELHNNLFELFTDVPIIPQPQPQKDLQTLNHIAAAFRRAVVSSSGEIDSQMMLHWFNIRSYGETRSGAHYRGDEYWVGAASLLLDVEFQQAEPLVILEGAPGQGKSTISQYICQVHRKRILGRADGEDVGSKYLDSSLRLPFKVELRDFATWLSGRNPFVNSDLGNAPADEELSLEGFLAALVRYESGGTEFTVSDLLTTFNFSAVLIVLDGLDEVADVELRQEVVRKITTSVARLKSVAASLQVVITSRPTHFSNATVLPSETFKTYSLGSLARPLISEYANRWLKSRDIDESDARDVRTILDTKLDEPHLRDLARNPMQLAILLSLIHRRGVSLPDLRTALYDDYVDLFFDREAEKAKVVKENRLLLIRIHRYLAWVLHAGAEAVSDTALGLESSGTIRSGSITEADLKSLLRQFLVKEGNDPALVDELFSGMVDRVVAIVSRVQGTYEFDVQTLREYFVARYLYETAPYSPPGNQQVGTRSDRWRALSRNFYWLNVARFYAGCYTEGELASLIHELSALKEDEVFRLTSHPQQLIATLLQDRVFSQLPKMVENAVDLLLEPRGLRILVAGGVSGLGRVEEVVVRDPSGKRRLVSLSQDLVKSNLHSEQVIEIVQSMLRPNARPEELFEWWADELRSAEASQISRWCAIGYWLGCWSIMDGEVARNLHRRNPVLAKRVITELLSDNRMDLLESDEQFFELAVDAILDGERVGWWRGGRILQRLSSSIDLTLIGGLHMGSSGPKQVSLLEHWNEIQGDEEQVKQPGFPAAEKCASVVQAFETAAECPMEIWENSIEPWDRFVNQGIIEFGERTRFVDLANIAAGVRSKEEKCVDSNELFDAEQPIVRRARYARLRAGSRNWWSTQLQAATNTSQIRMALLLFFTWAGTTTIVNLAEMVDELLVGLKPSEWRSLHASLRTAIQFNSDRTWIKTLGIRVEELPTSLSVRAVALLSERSNNATRQRLYQRYLVDYIGDDLIVSALRANMEVMNAFRDDTKWPNTIESLKRRYRLDALTIDGFVRYHHHGHRPVLPDAIAKDVVNNPLDFPANFVRAAESRCRELSTNQILPVGRVAADEGWFVEHNPS